MMTESQDSFTMRRWALLFQIEVRPTASWPGFHTCQVNVIDGDDGSGGLSHRRRQGVGPSYLTWKDRVCAVESPAA